MGPALPNSLFSPPPSLPPSSLAWFPCLCSFPPRSLLPLFSAPLPLPHCFVCAHLVTKRCALDRHSHSKGGLGSCEIILPFVLLLFEPPLCIFFTHSVALSDAHSAAHSDVHCVFVQSVVHDDVVLSVLLCIVPCILSSKARSSVLSSVRFVVHCLLSILCGVDVLGSVVFPFVSSIVQFACSLYVVLYIL